MKVLIIFQIEHYTNIQNSPVLRTQLGGIIKQVTKAKKKVILISNDKKSFITKQEYFKEIEHVKIDSCSSSLLIYLRSILALYKIIRREKISGNKVKVYARNIYSGILMSIINKFTNISCIYDTRGDFIAESFFSNPKRKWYIYFLEFFEKKTIISSDTCCFVTNELKKTVFKRHSLLEENLLSKGKKILIIPSCAEVMEPIKEVSNDKYHLVYSGGISQYQCIEPMLKIWKELEIISSEFKFSFLTSRRNTNSVNALVHKEQIKNIRIYSFENDCDLNEYLNNCSYGFLLREENGVNRVASPVKFSEYLRSNLKVITTNGLKDISEKVTKKRLGIIIDLNHSASSTAALIYNFIKKDNLNKNSFEVFENHYSFKSHYNIYNEYF